MCRSRSLSYFDKLVPPECFPDLVKAIKRLQSSLQQGQLLGRKHAPRYNLPPQPLGSLREMSWRLRWVLVCLLQDLQTLLFFCSRHSTTISPLPSELRATFLCARAHVSETLSDAKSPRRVYISFVRSDSTRPPLQVTEHRLPLVGPRCPLLAIFPCEDVEIRSGAARLDEPVGFVGFSAVPFALGAKPRAHVLTLQR